MDIINIRTEEGLKKIKNSQKKRFASEYLVDLVANFDTMWKKLRQDQDNINTEINRIQIEIGKLYKANKNDDAQKLIRERENLKLKKEKEQAYVEKMLQMRNEYWNQIGNIVHPSVPVSNTEDDNLEIRKWGNPKLSIEAPLHHSEILHRIDGYNLESGIAIAGHRSYFLKGPGVLLNQALINYAIYFLTCKKYGKLGTEKGMEKESEENKLANTQSIS